jgi:hypothetical protein
MLVLVPNGERNGTRSLIHLPLSSHIKVSHSKFKMDKLSNEKIKALPQNWFLHMPHPSSYPTGTKGSFPGGEAAGV